jgi:prolipoprotein diacylglyceryltransferase
VARLAFRRDADLAQWSVCRDGGALEVFLDASFFGIISGQEGLSAQGGLVIGFLAGCIWVLTREHVNALRASLASNEAD